MSFTYGIASSASQDRLEKLIEKRLKSGAGKSRVDEQIWNLFGERWAIMFTDLSGFSRRVADFGIIHFLQTIYESNRLLVPIIEEYSGILLKVKGDSLLVIFRSVDEAIECAVAMQRCAKEYNRKCAENEQVLLCVGLGFGDVLRIGDSDVFGAEVNAFVEWVQSARLRDGSEPILMPGDPERASRRARAERVPIDPGTLAELDEAAAAVSRARGVVLPPLSSLVV